MLGLLHRISRLQGIGEGMGIVKAITYQYRTRNLESLEPIFLRNTIDFVRREGYATAPTGERVDELRDKLKRESAAKTPRKPKMDPLLLQAYKELKLEGRLPSDIRLHGYDIRTSNDRE